MTARKYLCILCINIGFGATLNADVLLVGTGLTATPTTQAGLLTTQDLAQSFTLNTTAEITSVQALIGGFAYGQALFQLTNALGPGAGPSNVLAEGAFDVPNTVFPNGDLFSFATNLDVSAGTYYLVASSIVQGGWWPMTTTIEPSPFGSIGLAYYTLPGDLNTFPAASTWTVDGCLQCTQDGFRIIGQPVPEPSTLLPLATALFCIILLRSRIRARPLRIAGTLVLRQR